MTELERDGRKRLYLEKMAKTTEIIEFLFYIVVEFQGHSLNQWVGYMSVWVPGAGGVVWSHPFCLCNTSCAV